jgi:Holliday junction resolvase-like predicted endonuclease
MAEHNELGKLGEELAVEFLQNGYIILDWTFRGRGGYYCPKAILAV